MFRFNKIKFSVESLHIMAMGQSDDLTNVPNNYIPSTNNSSSSSLSNLIDSAATDIQGNNFLKVESCNLYTRIKTVLLVLY